MKQDQAAQNGSWGGRAVVTTNNQGAQQVWSGLSKLGGKFDQQTGAERQQFNEVKERYKQIYEMHSHPPECFVAQMAFTSLNSFLLTTDGRVFSWGALFYCLGRQVNQY